MTDLLARAGAVVLAAIVTLILVIASAERANFACGANGGAIVGQAIVR